MSPPITPAPTTCTWRTGAAPLPPSALSRSCRKNTRTRLREVRAEQLGDRPRLGLVRARRARRAAPQVHDRVRRRIVLARARARTCASIDGSRRNPHRRPRQRALEQRRAARAGRERSSSRAAASSAVRVVDEPIDEADRSALSARIVLAGQHQVHRRAHADEAHGAHGAAEAGMDAELTSGRPSATAVVRPRRGTCRRGRARARRRARSRGSRRRSGRAGPRAGRARAARCGPVRSRSRRCRAAAELGDVGPGDETVRLAGAQHQPRRGRPRARRVGRRARAARPSTACSSTRPACRGEPGDAVSVTTRVQARIRSPTGRCPCELAGRRGAAGRSGRGESVAADRGLDVEVADDRAVIGIAHVGDAEVGHLDAVADEDEVQLDPRIARRERQQVLRVGALQAGGRMNRKISSSPQKVLKSPATITGLSSR
jgi:hypothetical protein